jgi:3-keto-disaccharide hydrolase
MKTIAALIAAAQLLAASARAQDWKSIFDGKSFAGWTSGSGGPVGAGWQVAEGAIHRAGKGGDILTASSYQDFELEFEWKIAAGANSGLKYRVADYSPAGKNIGLEFQVIDDAGHADGKNARTSAASIYDLIPPAASKKLSAVGEWNRSKIVARGAQLEHWLNGEKVVSATIGSPEWSDALAKSKFRAAADMGTKKGRILLQDHGGEVWFRNLRIRELLP